MGWKQHLGDISPVFGAATGEGMMGRLLNPDEATNIADKEQAEAAAAKKKAMYDHANSSRAQNMKKGGKVSSASSRGDGCACRGKTKGRIV